MRAPARRAAASAVGVSLVGLLGVACSTAPEAVEETAFTECASSAGVSFADSSEWSDSEWTAAVTRPGVLRCAVEELDAGQRSELLDRGLPELEDPEPAWQAVADHAAEVAEQDGVDRALAGSEALISSISWPDDDAARWAARVAAVAAMRGVGAFPGIDDFLAESGLQDDQRGLYEYSLVLERDDDRDFLARLETLVDSLDLDSSS